MPSALTAALNQGCTEARDPKSGQVTSIRKISIAISSNFANAPIPGERHGSVAASMRASAGSLDLGGPRKFTAVHRPSNAYDFFGVTADLSPSGADAGQGRRRLTAIHPPSISGDPGLHGLSSLGGSSPPANPTIGDATGAPATDPSLLAPPAADEPGICVETRRLSLGAAPLHIFGLRRGSIATSMEASDETEEDTYGARRSTRWQLAVAVSCAPRAPSFWAASCEAGSAIVRDPACARGGRGGGR